MATALKKKLVKSASSYAKVDVRRFPVADLQPAPYNARQITDVALKGLVTSMEQFGLLALPVVNLLPDGTARLIGGHQRIEGLKQEGVQEVDCVVVTFDDVLERRANFTLNNPRIEGTFVPELTRDLLKQLDAAFGAQAPGLFEGLRFDTLLREVLQQIGSVEGVDDVISDGKTMDDEDVALGQKVADSKIGAFYQLGPHRLYCGKLVEVGTLEGFGVERANMAFTRFPESPEYAEDFLAAYLGHTLANTDGGVYVSVAEPNLAQVHRAFVTAGGHWSNTLVCFDPNAKGRATDLYRPVALPILYGWREGVMRMFYGDRTQANCWHLKKSPPKDDLPVEAVVRHLLKSSKKDGYVLDVRVGRGTTVIAAQKTGRRVIGYVPGPRDMDRVRARWARFAHGPDVSWKSVTHRVA